MNLFTDTKWAPARMIIDAKLKQVMRGDIKIGNGAGGHSPNDPTKPPASKQICIMEATAYILGHDINDNPPCTDELISGLLIEVNDLDISMRKRAMLKQVITDIINTAPTKWVELRIRKTSIMKLKTDDKDKRFREVQNQREQMIDAWTIANGTEDTYWTYRLQKGYLPMTKFIEFIRELAAVGKFGTQNEDTEINGNREDSK